MAEWSIASVLKTEVWSIASVLKTEVLKGTGGSNPSLSAVKLVGASFSRCSY